MPPVEWSPKIDLGNVLTLLGMVISLVAAAYAVKGELRQLAELFRRHEEYDDERFTSQGTEIDRLRSNAHGHASNLQTLANKQGALDERTSGLTRRVEGIEDRERLRLERQHP